MIRCGNCGIELSEEEAVESSEGNVLCVDYAEEEEEDMFDYLLIIDEDEGE